MHSPEDIYMVDLRVTTTMQTKTDCVSSSLEGSIFPLLSNSPYIPWSTVGGC